MLHRIVATLIIAFWMLMTTLFVIEQMYPEKLGINSVPVSFVGRLFFQHEQTSDLEIYDQDKDAGHLHLQPRIEAASGLRILETSGNITFNLPGNESQRIGWSGALYFDDALKAKRIRLGFTLQGNVEKILLDINPAEKTVRYSVKAPNVSPEEKTLTLDAAGFAALLGQAGISPAMLTQFSGDNVSQFLPEFFAQQSSVKLNGETASTFLVTMKVSDQPIFEAHLSQLGQVLKARIPALGYRLAIHNVAP